MLPDCSNEDDLVGLTDPTLNDATTASYLGIVATHAYSGTITPYANAQNKGKPLWETEVSSFGGFDGSITDGLYWAANIHQFLTVANASAWQAKSVAVSILVVKRTKAFRE